MTGAALSWFEWYQTVRRRAEIGFWVDVLSLEALFNGVVMWLDMGRVNVSRPQPWEIAVWEISSALAVGLLLLPLLAFERWRPLRWTTLPRNLLWHLAGSVVFCLAHVSIMVGLRHAAYSVAGGSYDFGNWGANLFYEYLKDVRSYASILATVLGYRFFMLRLQGEARVLDAPEPAAGEVPAAGPEPAQPAARPERFLVRKLRSEFLIAAGDIEWLQAQGNYVGLRVKGHDYLLRSTLNDFLEQLDPARFVRVHRSYAVNLDCLAEIEPQDGGDARLRMKDGASVPCSRRYRDSLRG